MKYEILNRDGSTFIYQQKHLSAAIHYAQSHNLKVRDRETGNIIADFCKSKHKEKSNVKF